MNVTIEGTICTVTREPGDPRPHGVRNAKGESTLLYHVKKALALQGYDLVKKRMWRDGHLVDDCQQYLRSRKPSGDHQRDICIFNSYWAVRGAEEDFNKEGTTCLAVVYGVFSDTPPKATAEVAFAVTMDVK